MIDYSKVLSRHRLENIREIIEEGQEMLPEQARATILILLEHAKVFDMALQSLTPMGSEYVNDPKRCVERVRETRDTHHRLIVKFGAEARQLREALRGAVKLPRPWMDGGVTEAEWIEAFDKIEAALAAEH